MNELEKSMIAQREKLLSQIEERISSMTMSLAKGIVEILDNDNLVFTIPGIASEAQRRHYLESKITDKINDHTSRQDIIRNVTDFLESQGLITHLKY